MSCCNYVKCDIRSKDGIITLHTKTYVTIIRQERGGDIFLLKITRIDIYQIASSYFAIKIIYIYIYIYIYI